MRARETLSMVSPKKQENMENPVFADSILLLTDSYKVTHHKQYSEGTEKIYSYFESRGGKWDDSVFFGLQYFMMQYLEGTRVTTKKIDEAEEIFISHFPGWKKEDNHFNRFVFNLKDSSLRFSIGLNYLLYRAGWEYIVKEHSGKLPISIRAPPEGTIVPVKNVLMTIENTGTTWFRECFVVNVHDLSPL